MKQSKIGFNLQIPEKLADEIKQAADEKSMTKTQFILDCIRSTLHQDGEVDQLTTALRRYGREVRRQKELSEQLVEVQLLFVYEFFKRVDQSYAPRDKRFQDGVQQRVNHYWRTLLNSIEGAGLFSQLQEQAARQAQAKNREPEG